MSIEAKEPRTLTGKVKSAKMDKTIAVEIERIVPHPVYGKFIRRSGTVLAHDENNESREGDVVVVAACRPISKRKVWKFQQVVETAK
jgi:small subunit ribosomal protein S17